MTAKEKMVVDTLKKTRVDKLLDLWEETEKKQITAEVAMVRGWIMDALEAKNPEAFSAWMDAYDGNPRAHFLS